MPTERRLPAPPKQPIDPASTSMEIEYNWWRWFHLISIGLPKVETYSQELNPLLVAANTTAEQSFTVGGLDVNDIVYVNAPALSIGLGIVNVRVSSANTLSLTFCNVTGSTIDPASGTYKIVSIRL